MDRSELALVVHEIGGAIAPARSTLQLLRRGDAGNLRPDQVRLLAILERSLDRAGRVLDNLSHLTCPDQPLTGEDTCDLAGVLDALVQDFQAEAGAQDLEIRLQCEPETLEVPTTRGALEQVLVNLLGNAIKYTPAGGRIDVAAGLDTRAVLPTRKVLLAGIWGTRPRFVRIRVRDTGPGLADETRSRLFQPFFRGPEARNTPGSGLGLTVARRLARQLHGDLFAEEVDAGASFAVVLPADAATLELVRHVDTVQAALRRRLEHRAMTVLVLHDDADETGRLHAELPRQLRRALPGERVAWHALAPGWALAWAPGSPKQVVRGLAAALEGVAPGLPGRIDVGMRRAPRGAPPDDVLLQAVVRCKRPLRTWNHRRREVISHAPRAPRG